MAAIKKTSVTKSQWLSIYLFYAEPWEEFIKKTVNPFVISMLNCGYIDQFFFIRYWEGGPHIRLRLKGSSKQINGQVKPAALKYFKNFFKKQPSKILKDIQLHKSDYAEKIFPNNSIFFIRYYPEIKRYGGKYCICIAEQQFEISSRVVIEAINNSKHWDYETALGMALKLHLIMIFSMKLSIKESRMFFSTLSTGLVKFFHSNFSTANNDESVLFLYQKNYLSQKNTLFPYCKHFWDAINNHALPDNSFLCNWQDDMQNIHKQLKLKQKLGQYQVPKKFLLSNPNNFSLENFGLFSIYQSFVHMTNNRLGIKNQDEGYLAYLLQKFFEEISLHK